MGNAPATTLLREWLNRTKIPQLVLAKDLQVSEPHLSRLIAGKALPSLPLAVRIANRTGVPATAWIASTTEVGA